MRARIHRGAHEVGGSCVELEHSGARIVIDLGRPLDSDFDVDLPLPSISVPTNSRPVNSPRRSLGWP